MFPVDCSSDTSYSAMEIVSVLSTGSTYGQYDQLGRVLCHVYNNKNKKINHPNISRKHIFECHSEHPKAVCYRSDPNTAFRWKHFNDTLTRTA